MNPEQVYRDRRALRRQLRAARAALPVAHRRALSQRISLHVARLPWFQRHARLSLYASMGSEVQTAELLALALARGARVYLPRIAPGAHAHLRMCRYRGQFARRHRMGMNEPPWGESPPLSSLDLVLLPLLAFDAAGQRLGYGGGFYDRLLAPAAHAAGRRPLRIGIAYACQEVPHLALLSHDVPLHGVLTERGLRMFARDTRP